MSKTAVAKKQEEILNTPEKKLIFATPKSETEMYAVRLTKDTANRVRDYCKTMNVAQQEFMEEGLKFILEHLKQVDDKAIKEAETKRKRRKA